MKSLENVHLVLDLDGVGFDSDRYKIDLASKLTKFSDHDFDELYKSGFNHRGFSPRLLAAKIAAEQSGQRPIDPGPIADKLTAGLSNYIYPDAKEFIFEFKARKLGRISILTAGDPEFQNLKIDGSGFATMISDVYVVPYNNRSDDRLDRTAMAKTGLLPALQYNNQPLVFLDDSASTIKRAQESYSREDNIIPILLDRNNNSPSGIPNSWPNLDIKRLESLFD